MVFVITSYNSNEVAIQLFKMADDLGVYNIKMFLLFQQKVKLFSFSFVPESTYEYSWYVNRVLVNLSLFINASHLDGFAHCIYYVQIDK